MVSRNSNFFSQENDKFIFYSEIYNADEVFGEDMVFLIEARISDTKTGKVYHNTGIFKKMKAAAVNPILAEVDLSKLPSGSYNLNIEIKDKTNKSLFTKQKFFQRYHPLLEDPNLVVEKEESFEDQTFDDCLIKESIDMRNLTFLLNGLMPLAKQNERSFAEAVANSGDEEQKINYLCYFFQKRETNEKDAQTLFLEYKDRLEIAEKQYATQTMAGYQTDRGRVFIQYGKPNRVDNEFSDMTRTAINNAVIPYEIWTYYNVIEPQPQSNVQFVFAQKNRANYNYEIVHSTAIGEFKNPSWREEINSRMMYQEDSDQGYR
jgi:GWxTD domain-containing protein